LQVGEHAQLLLPMFHRAKIGAFLPLAGAFATACAMVAAIS
jgi:hypothetical protein